jgi:hypothetical protein
MIWSNSNSGFRPWLLLDLDRLDCYCLSAEHRPPGLATLRSPGSWIYVTLEICWTFEENGSSQDHAWFPLLATTVYQDRVRKKPRRITMTRITRLMPEDWAGEAQADWLKRS